MAPQGIAKSDEPTVDELIAMCPSLDSSNPACRDFEFRQSGLSDEPERVGSKSICFRAVYRAPDKFGLLIYDGSDNTPLIYAMDGKVLLYDPSKPVVLCMPRCEARR